MQSQGQRQVFPTSSTTYTLTANGPGGSDTRTVTVSVNTPPPPPPPANTGPRLSSAEMLQQQSQDAFFDYDKSDIRADARDALTRDAGLLKQIFAQDPNFTVVVEGHCDERGSAEYNLGSGRQARQPPPRTSWCSWAWRATASRPSVTARNVRSVPKPMRSAGRRIAGHIFRPASEVVSKQRAPVIAAGARHRLQELL